MAKQAIKTASLAQVEYIKKNANTISSNIELIKDAFVPNALIEIRVSIDNILNDGAHVDVKKSDAMFIIDMLNAALRDQTQAILTSQMKGDVSEIMARSVLMGILRVTARLQ